MASDVLIIGGGLAGCATAYFLAREGVDVTLLERFDLNMRASGANAGSLHLQIPHAEFLEFGEDWARRFAPTLPMMRQSVELWMSLGEELGADLQAVKTGGLLVAQTADEMAAIARKSRIEAANGIDIHLLSRSELQALAPYISDQMMGAAYCPDEGKASPLHATRAFASAAQQLGSTIVTQCAVLGISRDDKDFLVATSRGQIRSRRIVNAAGADAGQIAAMVGVEWPIGGYPLQLMVTEPIAPIISHLVYSAGDKLSLKQLQNGTCIIGGGWPANQNTDGTTSVNSGSLRGNLLTASRAVPSLKNMRIARAWSAIVNGTEDWRPVLGEVPGVPRFYLNLFPYMGFTAGPMAGLVTADLILGRDPPVDLSAISSLA